MNERIHSALILCDFDRYEDIEKATEIKRQLGEIGIYSSASDLENDGFAPSTPWLEYDGTIYYSYEIDRVISMLQIEKSTKLLASNFDHGVADWLTIKGVASL